MQAERLAVFVEAPSGTDEEEEGLDDLVLSVNPYCTFYSLKNLLAERWPLPSLCQRVLVDGGEPDDGTLLSKHVNKVGELHACVEESYATLSAILQHENSAMRLQGIRALTRVAQKDYNRAAEEFGKTFQGLDDPDAENRIAAALILAAVAPKGDETALKMLAARFMDAEASVRSAACEGLYCLSERGNKVVGLALRTHMTSWRGEVRRDATRALGLLGAKGGAVDVKALCTKLEDQDSLVRSLAIEALAKIIERGDPVVLAELVVKLTHKVREVRITALHALKRFCNKEEGDESWVARVVPLLKDEVREERRVATEVLAMVSPKAGMHGHRPALRAFMELLGDPLPPHPIPKEEGDNKSNNSSDAGLDEQREGELVEAFLDQPKPPPDSDWRVRRLAVHGVAAVARLGDADAIVAVTDRLEDESREVRRAAALVVPRICPVFGFKPTQPVVVTCHPHVLVPYTDGKKFDCDDVCGQCTRVQEGPTARWSCRECMYDLCRGCTNFYRSDRIGLAGVLQRIGHKSEDVRFVAMKGLASIAPGANYVIISRLVNCLRKGSSDSRRLAMELLLRLADPSSEAAEAVRTAPQHPPPPPPQPKLVEEEAESGKGVGKAPGKAAGKIAGKVADKGTSTTTSAAGKSTAAPKAPALAAATAKDAAPAAKLLGPVQDSAAALSGDGLESESSYYPGSEEEQEDASSSERGLAHDDDYPTEEELRKLPPADAIEAAFVATRRVALKQLDDSLAELRAVALKLLDKLLPRPGTLGSHEVVEAIARRLKDQDEHVRSLAADILERAVQEPPVLGQSSWPLGIRLSTSYLYDEASFNARTLAQTRRDVAFDKRMASRTIAAAACDEN